MKRKEKQEEIYWTTKELMIAEHSAYEDGKLAAVKAIFAIAFLIMGMALFIYAPMELEDKSETTTLPDGVKVTINTATTQDNINMITKFALGIMLMVWGASFNYPRKRKDPNECCKGKCRKKCQ